MFDSIDVNETEMAASEEAILTQIGIKANSLEVYHGQQKNKSGNCAQCGSKIPKARLEIFPNCNHCVKCQEIIDGAGENRRAQSKSRPFLNIPLQAIFKDDKIEDEDIEEAEEKDKGEDCIRKDDLSANAQYILNSKSKKRNYE